MLKFGWFRFFPLPLPLTTPRDDPVWVVDAQEALAPRHRASRPEGSSSPSSLSIDPPGEYLSPNKCNCCCIFSRKILEASYFVYIPELMAQYVDHGYNVIWPWDLGMGSWDGYIRYIMIYPINITLKAVLTQSQAFPSHPSCCWHHLEDDMRSTPSPAAITVAGLCRKTLFLGFTTIQDIGLSRSIPGG